MEVAKEMDCSEDACVIKIILIPASDKAPNKRAAIPGTPTIPLPCNVIKLISFTAEIPFTTLVDSVSFSFEIIVPGN